MTDDTAEHGTQTEGATGASARATGAADDTVDAVVIGAGPNGLVAANLLADAGWNVLVLEAAAEPGGAVRSGEITAPGFISDLCSAFYPLGAASPVLSELELEKYGLHWLHAPDVLAHILPDGRAAVLSRDLDRTAAAVDAFAPGDGDAWRTQFALWERVGTELIETILRPFPPVRSATRLLRAGGSADALRLARMAVVPVRRFISEEFSGAGAQLLISGCALHTDLSPEQAGSAAFGWLLAMLGQQVGFPVPAGGAGALTAALTRRLHRRGGRLECGRAVRSVVVAGGIALGVVDSEGQRIRATRAVLADVGAPALYRDLVGIDLLPARMARDLDRFEWDHAIVKLDWALSGPVPWSNPDVAGAGTVHLGGDLDDLTRYSADLACGQVPEAPLLLLGQMTTSDPRRSPEGTEALWAYSHLPRGLADDADTVRRYADRLQENVERYAPGFTDRILARTLQGPKELDAENPGLVEGSLNYGTSAVHQELFLRPVPGLGRADTPIDRLYLAGASAHPGGGVHGAPGANAARAALARNHALGGGAYAAMIRAGHRVVYGSTG